jgi:hypothetical protein
MLSPALGTITPHPIVQLGWSVFEDIDVAMMRWTQATGIGPFFVGRHVSVDDVVHRGAPGSYDHSSAIAQWGEIQLELMEQHCDSPSAIRDISPDRRSRLASVSWIVPDLPAEIDRMAALGFPVVWSCTLFDGTISATWFDTTALLGCYAEIFIDNAPMRRAFAQCRKAAEGWSGDRPIRDMAEMLAIDI